MPCLPEPPDHDATEWRAGNLGRADADVFRPAPPVAQVFDWFNEHRTQTAAAIIDTNGHVVGIVNRLRFLSRYAQRYFPDCTARTIRTETYSQQQASRRGRAYTRFTSWPPCWPSIGPMHCANASSFRAIGRYLGIGTCEAALVRSKVQLLTTQEGKLKNALLRATDAQPDQE